MSDVAFYRTNPAKARVGSVASKCLAQRFKFHRVAKRGGGSMCFDIVNAARIHAGIVERRRDYGRLTINAWCSETGLGTPVVVDAHTTYHCIYGIAVRYRG